MSTKDPDFAWNVEWREVQAHLTTCIGIAMAKWSTTLPERIFASWQSDQDSAMATTTLTISLDDAGRDLYLHLTLSMLQLKMMVVFTHAHPPMPGITRSLCMLFKVDFLKKRYDRKCFFRSRKLLVRTLWKKTCDEKSLQATNQNSVLLSILKTFQIKLLVVFFALAFNTRP